MRKYIGRVSLLENERRMLRAWCFWRCEQSRLSDHQLWSRRTTRGVTLKFAKGSTAGTRAVYDAEVAAPQTRARPLELLAFGIS